MGNPRDVFSNNYIFGYGSLVEKDQLEKYIEFNKGNDAVRYCRLKGYRRIWNVAMNNSVSIKGYKYYLDKKTGERPDYFVTFLNITKHEKCSILGVLFKVKTEKIIDIDKRERNYKRVDITHCLDIPVDGIAWTYIGLKEAENRFIEGLKQNKAVIPEQYFNLVYNAYASLGPRQLKDYLSTTDIPNIPKVDLKLQRT